MTYTYWSTSRVAVISLQICHYFNDDILRNIIYREDGMRATVPPMLFLGIAQYNDLGAYCGLITDYSEVFLIFYYPTIFTIYAHKCLHA